MRLRYHLLALAAVLYGAPANAGNKDAEAKKLAEQAIAEDYLATRFAAAIKKLEKAIQLCGADSCSPAVVARLYRDLGSVYITGQKKPAKGKPALKKALAADPSIELDPNLESPELRAAFDEIRGGTPAEAEPAASDVTPAGECEPGTEGCDVEEETPEEAPPEDDSGPGGVLANWLSLSIAQDFLLYGSSGAVCPTVGPDGVAHADENYRCFAGDQAYEGTVYALSGNEIKGGIGVATTRLMLGYDRLLGEQLLLGARVGYAFGGPPTAPGESAFLPLHLEARAAFYFGSGPFASSSLRPYVHLAAGMAQVAGKVSVQVFQDEAGYAADQRSKLDAWRKAGNVFAAGGFGLELPIGSSAIRAEARFMQLFGTGASALSGTLGYALGL